MKNTVVYLFFILFLVSGIAFSQIYFKVGGGYNLDFNSMEFGENSTSSVTGPTSYECVYGSLGKGVNFAGAFGYNLTSNLGLELGITYKLSTDLDIRHQSGTSVAVKKTAEPVTPAEELGNSDFSRFLSHRVSTGGLGKGIRKVLLEVGKLLLL